MAHKILNSPLLASFLVALGIALVVLIRDLAVIDKGDLWFLRGCLVGILGYGVVFSACCIAVVKKFATSLNIAWRI